MYAIINILYVSIFCIQSSLAIDGQWTQCGGKRDGIPWGPENTCASGYSCQEVNEWYWQCKQGGSSNGGNNGQGGGNKVQSGGNAQSGGNYRPTGSPALQGGSQPSSTPPSGSSANAGAGSSVAPWDGGGSKASGASPSGSSAPGSGSSSSAAANPVQPDNSKQQPATGSVTTQTAEEEGDEDCEEEKEPLTQPGTGQRKLAVSKPEASGFSNALSNIGGTAFFATGDQNGDGNDDFSQGNTNYTAVETGPNAQQSSGIAPLTSVSAGVPIPGGASGQGTSSRYTVSPGDVTSCGCAGTWLVPGDGPIMTAAINTANYGDTNACSNMCGTCFELTSTGGAPDGEGAPAGQPNGKITVMITDACPEGSNKKWCAVPNIGKKTWHFDIAIPESNKNGPNGWDNPFVNFVQVGCGGGKTVAKPSSMTQKRQAVGGIHDNYASCRCAKEGKGSLKERAFFEEEVSTAF